MRQAGYKPKNHNSGVYWVRANAKTGNKSEAEIVDNREQPRWYHYGIVGVILCWVLLYL